MKDGNGKVGAREWNVRSYKKEKILEKKEEESLQNVNHGFKSRRGRCVRSVFVCSMLPVDRQTIHV